MVILNDELILAALEFVQKHNINASYALILRSVLSFQQAIEPEARSAALLVLRQTFDTRGKGRRCHCVRPRSGNNRAVKRTIHWLTTGSRQIQSTNGSIDEKFRRMTPMTMREARRWPGSEWIKDHPAALEKVYAFTVSAVKAAYPLMKRVSPRATERVMIWNRRGRQRLSLQLPDVRPVHSAQHRHDLPHELPKNLRNGPCGGVRANGHCEVIPERMCVWVQAWERSQKMPMYGHELSLAAAAGQPQPEGTASSWDEHDVEGIDTQITHAGLGCRASPTGNERSGTRIHCGYNAGIFADRRLG
jgi:hypothetical protein